jgi:hypothetical protein
VETEGGCYKWRVNLDSIARNFNSLVTFPLAGTTCPVPALFIAGANSDYVRSVCEARKTVIKYLRVLRLKKISAFFFLGGHRGMRTPKHFVNLTGESKNFKM